MVTVKQIPSKKFAKKLNNLVQREYRYYHPKWTNFIIKKNNDTEYMVRTYADGHRVGKTAMAKQIHLTAQSRYFNHFYYNKYRPDNKLRSVSFTKLNMGEFKYT